MKGEKTALSHDGSEGIPLPEYGMIYYTGGIHGEVFWVSRFCKRMRLTKEDTVVILGDVAANYYEDERD